jgi:putative ABC transport system permease protein
MHVVLVRVMAELSARRSAAVFLVVTTAVMTAVLLTGVSASRRTATAMDRFLAYSRPVDLSMDPTVDLAALRRLPQVAAVEETALVPLVVSGQGTGGPVGLPELYPVVRFHGTEGTTMARPMILAGHRPDPADPGAIGVGESLAAAWHLRPGSVLTAHAFRPAQGVVVRASLDAALPLPDPAGPVLRLRVAAIQREPFDLVPESVSSDVAVQDAHVVYLSAAFAREYAGTVAMGTGKRTVEVALRRGQADYPAFAAAVRGLPGGIASRPLPGSQALDVAVRVTDALILEGAALLLLGLLAGLGGLFLAGQGLDREIRLFGAEHATLRALGMTVPQLAAVSTVRSAAVAVPGVALGIPVAVGASALFPVGLARQAEISPGMWVDVPVLVVGSTAAALLLIVRGAVGGVLAARPPVPGRSLDLSGSPAVLVRLAAAGLPLTVVTGIVRALRPGRRARPRPALIVAVGAAGVVAVTASLMVGATLDRLLSTPVLQGWDWDVMVGYQPDAPFAERAAQALQSDARVAGLAVSGDAGQVSVQGRDVPALVVGEVRGHLGQRLVSGRPAAAADEVVLGHATARRVGAGLGQEVSIAGEGSPRTYRVVGEAVLWTGVTFQGGMGTGAVLTPEGARLLLPRSPPPGRVLVRFAPGVPKEAAFRDLQRQFGRRVLRYQPAYEVQNLGRVRGVPFAVAGVFAAVGLLGVGMSLVSSVRSGLPEVAVLKALGLLRRQVYGAVTCQALTHGLLALLVGIPLGVAAGRWAWTVLALGVEARIPPVAPRTAILVAVPLTVLAMIAVAAVPATTAAAVRPAATLRAE